VKFLILALLILPTAATAALVDPRLQKFARQEGGAARVLVLMDVKPSRGLPARVNGSVVRRYLKEETNIAWKRVQPGLAASISNNQIRPLELLSINFSFSADVTPAGLRVLAQTKGLTKIYADGRIFNAMPTSRRAAPRFLENLPYDITAMGLDQVWKADPKLIGTGVIVGHIDTGIDGRHPALTGKIGLFFDAGKGEIVEPFDDGEHGTHTAGTILGSPRDGVPMGVAPGARMVAAAGLTDYPSMLKAMEFMLDPDGRADTFDQPRLVSNSWNCEGAPDLEAFYRAISAWEAAGIMTVFSAGNAGPKPRTITKPHEHPLSFAVGAFGLGGQIANFSSRGPGIFNGKETQKPDVSAPGVDIISAVPGGRYEAMSGTSMAAPHIAGLAAILFQIEPGLTPAKMRELLIRSSDFVNGNGQVQADPQWNPAYGFGRANALKAVNALSSLRGRQERRWGTFMAPVVDIAAGFGKMLNLNETKEEQIDLAAPFITENSRWIDGNSL
jgi:subtilisin family serine protease